MSVRVDGLYFLTMEFIDGEDLAALLRRIGRLPPDKAVEIARQVCAGLAAAHDGGVVRRGSATTTNLNARESIRRVAASLADELKAGLFIAVIVAFLVALLREVLRNEWHAAGAVVVIFALLDRDLALFARMWWTGM